MRGQWHGTAAPMTRLTARWPRLPAVTWASVAPAAITSARSAHLYAQSTCPAAGSIYMLDDGANAGLQARCLSLLPPAQRRRTSRRQFAQPRPCCHAALQLRSGRRARTAMRRGLGSRPAPVAIQQRGVRTTPGVARVCALHDAGRGEPGCQLHGILSDGPARSVRPSSRATSSSFTNSPVHFTQGAVGSVAGGHSQGNQPSCSEAYMRPARSGFQRGDMKCRTVVYL